MKIRTKNNGSVILVAIFVVALLATVVIGMVQINTEEIQVVQNHIYAAKALSIAEAGLNDAYSELRDDAYWTAGFTDKAFVDGSYTVTVTGTLPTLNVMSTGTTSNGYVSILDEEIIIAVDTDPHRLRTNRRRRK